MHSMFDDYVRLNDDLANQVSSRLMSFRVTRNIPTMIFFLTLLSVLLIGQARQKTPCETGMHPRKTWLTYFIVFLFPIHQL